MRILIVILLFSIVANSQRTIADSIPAFTGKYPAIGAGRYATGGSGGVVLKITNLNNSGPGSARAAFEDSRTRHIMKEIDGYIPLQSDIIVNNPNYSYHGHIGPIGGGGLVFISDGSTTTGLFQFQAGNAIIRFLKTFQGGSSSNPPSNGVSGDNLQIAGTYLYFDHCSVLYGRDENFSISNGFPEITTDHVSFSYGLVARGIGGNDSRGALIAGNINEISVVKNFFSGNNQRNPRTHCYSCTSGIERRFEYVNNLFYDYVRPAQLGNPLSAYGDNGGQVETNFIHNAWETSSASNTNYPIMVDEVGSQTYIDDGNIGPTRPPLDGFDPWDNLARDGTSSSAGVAAKDDRYSATPFNTTLVSEGFTPTPAAQLFNELSPHIGASIPGLLAPEQDVLDDYVAGVTSHPFEIADIVYPAIATGTIRTDTDGDGIPDDWEIAHELDRNVSNVGLFSLSPHYDDFEMYSMDVVNQVYPPDEPPVEVVKRVLKNGFIRILD
ncbi:hypothetical protein L0P88_04075 [Muricauda sp. SCSIO 64092]|uniref:hypothetical protein n=1 Tax=Allomuricauda sp. SCSIO 64092 TaxID=2908842 RepID=UPI001FF537D3|nr:hypothetical protein [Muricauda sp. SCSIO 64092]UOY07732.1 hypothetical protein L0P88_04075 [Muricauda sp. SCSIO 64092]